MTKPTDADNDALFGKDLRVYSKTELETEKMDSVESIEAQIKVLQSKLEFYKELSQTKTPCEEAYKRVYGHPPECAQRGVWDGFQEGYKQAQKNYTETVPAKDKVPLYERFENEGAYGQIYYDAALTVTREFLMDEGVIEHEDEEYVTFKLQKSLLEIPND